MGDILEFPSQQAQGLAYLERQLREMLAARGADQPLIDFASSELTQIYAQLSESEQYSFSVELPATLSQEEKDALATQIGDADRRSGDYRRHAATIGDAATQSQ